MNKQDRNGRSKQKRRTSASQGRYRWISGEVKVGRVNNIVRYRVAYRRFHRNVVDKTLLVMYSRLVKIACLVPALVIDVHACSHACIHACVTVSQPAPVHRYSCSSQGTIPYDAMPFLTATLLDNRETLKCGSLSLFTMDLHT